MYSDWEERSSAFGVEEAEGLDVTEMDEGNRRLALKQPLTGLTNGVLSGALVSEASDVPTKLQYTTWYHTYTWNRLYGNKSHLLYIEAAQSTSRSWRVGRLTDCG